MSAMKPLLLFITILCCSTPEAQAASVFRFFNPYFWFSSQGPETTTALVKKSQEAAVNEHRGNGSLSQNLNASRPITGSSYAHDSSHSPETASSPNLVAIPLQVQALNLYDNDTATKVAQILVPVQVGPLAPEYGVRRSGLIREKDMPESREEIDLQTPTTEPTRANETVTSASIDRKSQAALPSTDAAEATTTYQAESTTKVLPSAAATSFVKLANLVDDGEKISTTSVPNSSAVSPTTVVTVGTTRKESEEPAGSPSPVYVPSKSSDQQMSFLYREDFARHLNRQYYSSPTVFHAPVGRGSH